MTRPAAAAEPGSGADLSAELVAGWEDPPRAGHGVGAPVLTVEGFEGPLDWLVEMARAGKIDLARLSILALVEAFGAALEAGLAQRRGSSPSIDLGRWGEWLVLAATLALLRSRLLLPAGSAQAAAAAREAEALRRRLLDRAAMAAAADWLESRPRLGRDTHARGRPERGRGGRRGGDIVGLLRACLVVLQVPDDDAAIGGAGSRPAFWGVAAAAARITRLLADAPAGLVLAELLPGMPTDMPQRALQCRAAVASTLLAGLELARTGNVTLEQQGAWGDVAVQRRDAWFDPADATIAS